MFAFRVSSLLLALAAGLSLAPLSARAEPALLPLCDGGAGPCRIADVPISGRHELPVTNTTLAVDPADPAHLIGTATDYQCESLQGVYTSLDTGKTWKRQCRTAARLGRGGGQPIAAFGADGQAYVLGYDTVAGVGALVLQRSKDHGQNWGKPTIAILPPGGVGTAVLEPSFKVDHQPASPYRGTLYVSSTYSDAFDHTRIFVSRSHDNGASWQGVLVSPQISDKKPLKNNDRVAWSSLAIGADGSLNLSYLRCRGGWVDICGGREQSIMFQKSIDGGLSWSAPVTMTKVMAMDWDTCLERFGCIPNTAARASNVPALAIDTSSGPYSGRLYSVMYTNYAGFMKVVMASSADGGASWTKPRWVASRQAAGDQFLPWISVSATGAVGVSWLDRRDDAGNALFVPYAAVSTDGGQHFGRDLRLSEGRSDPAQDGFGSRWLGDWTSNVWAGDTLLMSTVDTRRGISEVRLVGVRP